MDIPRAGREYVRWPVTGLPDGADLLVSIDGGTTWHPTAREGDQVVVLVAGPDAPDNPADALALPDQRRTFVTFRAADNPEVIIRGGGTLDLV